MAIEPRRKKPMFQINKYFFILPLILVSELANAQDDFFANFTPKICRNPPMLNAKEVSKDLVAPFNDFAIRSWKALPKGQANAIYSPWSLYSVMGMALAGAKEKTAKEMAKSMGLAAVPTKAWHHLMLGVGGSLRCPEEWMTTTFTTVNGLFVQSNKALVEGFRKILVEEYQAEPITVDFNKFPEASRKTINAWVNKHTQERIKELLAKGSVDNAMRLVLANAAFVKGRWAKSFPKDRTKPEAFHIGKKQEIKVPMMHVDGGSSDFSYGVFDGFKAAGLKSVDGLIETVILLPNIVDGLAALEAKLNSKVVGKVAKGLVVRKVNLSMPRFKSGSSWQLEEPLKKLGMKQAFSAKKANFKGIDAGEDLLYVSSILQKATVAVDEDGFEAAAASAMMMRAGSAAPPPQDPVAFVADRPFLYLIREPASGAILFIGRVEDPNKA